MGNFWENSEIVDKEIFFYEFYMINMKKWIDFKNNWYKYVRILQVLKKIFQDLQKCSQKGHLVTLLQLVTKNLFYNKSCVFSKESTWHRCVVGKPEEMVQNWILEPLCSDVWVITIQITNFTLFCSKSLSGRVVIAFRSN